jgi:hypothetical protein
MRSQTVAGTDEPDSAAGCRPEEAGETTGEAQITRSRSAARRQEREVGRTAFSISADYIL